MRSVSLFLKEEYLQFMQYSNYHSHCIFCDGHSFPENFIRFAIQHHFRAYGFSSHSPLPFETNWNMSKDNMGEYLEEIRRIKEKYAHQLEIYAGLEIDYLDESYNASSAYFQQLPLDYRISSIHFLPLLYPLAETNMMCIDGSFRDFSEKVDLHYGHDIRRLVAHYFQSSCKMVELGGFDIVGHMDKIYMNAQHYPGFDLHAPWYKNAFLEYLDLIQEKNLMVEINTKNFCKKKELYPHTDFLSYLVERNIPILVNSDCHYPDLVNDGRTEAFKLLREKGFRSTYELVKGKWEEIPL